MLEQLSICDPFGGLRLGLGWTIGVVLFIDVEQLGEPFGGLRFGLGGGIGVVFF